MSQLTPEPAAPTVTDPRAVRQKIVDDAIAEVSHIATLPEITLKIIETVENPDSTANDLHKLIETDPALCARVLKVVNSAFYGLPGQIGSINRAIVLLGMNAVKNIAIAASLAKLFQGGRLTPRFSARDLWTHSIAVGAGVKLLAEKINLKLPDEAFLAGLIHDLGMMIEMQSMPAKLVEAFDHVHKGGLSLMEAEMQVIGATHQDFGKGLCEKWKFPRSFAFVTGYHHTPDKLERGNRTLTGLVHVADILSARVGIGNDGSTGNESLCSAILDELNLTDPVIDEATEQLPEAYEIADQLLS